MVPKTVQKKVTVDVPVNVPFEVTEQKAFTVTKDVPTKVMSDRWETIPDAPCHWHVEEVNTGCNTSNCSTGCNNGSCNTNTGCTTSNCNTGCNNGRC